MPDEYRSNRKEHDLALLELETPVIFNNKTCANIRPACLYQPDGRALPSLTIIGFGRTDINTLNKSDWLQKGTVNEVSLSECKRLFSIIPGEKIGDSQICAHDMKYDTCQGSYLIA